MRPQDRREAALRQLECRIAARGRILAHGRSDERPRQGQVRHVVARGGQGYGPPAIEQHQTAVRLHDGNSLLLLYEDPSGTDVAQQDQIAAPLAEMADIRVGGDIDEGDASVNAAAEQFASIAFCGQGIGRFVDEGCGEELPPVIQAVERLHPPGRDPVKNRARQFSGTVWHI